MVGRDSDPGNTILVPTDFTLPEPVPGAVRAMKAMILAAGKGTRIRPLTESIPKPMVPIINKPLLEFLVDLLRQHGFDEIMISTSYLANQIENYFADGSRFGVHIGYSFEGHHRDGQVLAEGRRSRTSPASTTTPSPSSAATRSWTWTSRGPWPCTARARPSPASC